jgi:uncharacterized membrane protein
LASAGGALAIGLAALLFSVLQQLLTGDGRRESYVWILPAAVIGGLVGSVTDSLMGASVQSIYFCPQCAKETEKRLHGCGTGTQHQRGWRWLDNDVVNFISSLVGALAAAALFLLL